MFFVHVQSSNELNDMLKVQESDVYFTVSLLENNRMQLNIKPPVRGRLKMTGFLHCFSAFQGGCVCTHIVSLIYHSGRNTVLTIVPASLWLESSTSDTKVSMFQDVSFIDPWEEFTISLKLAWVFTRLLSFQPRDNYHR